MTRLISVIMSVYNGGKYLRDAVDSILNQTFTDFEFIIINDGSTDESKAILESYNDDRIVLIYQENVGITKSLNKGLALAKGKYIARQDADDISHPDRFNCQVRYMEENPDCLVLGTWMDVINEEGVKYNTFQYPTRFSDIREAMKTYDPIGHGTIMARTSVLVENGGYNEKFYYAQDYDFWLRLSEVGEIHNLPEELYSLRFWDGSISMSKGYIQESFANIARQDAIARSYPAINNSFIENKSAIDPKIGLVSDIECSSKKIKVLYLSHSSEIAGAENALFTLLNFLNKNLFTPIAILPSLGPLKIRIEAIGIKTYIVPLEWNVSDSGHIPISDNSLKQRVDNLIHIMELEKPDIVQTNTSVIWEGALAAKACGIPHIWHVHENLPRHPSLSPLTPLPLHYAVIDEFSVKVVVVSDCLRNDLEPFISHNKLLTIYNGIDSERFKILPDKFFRKQLGISEDATVAVTLGSLVKEKGYDVLLTAAYFCKSKGSDVKFIIVGSGSAEAVQTLLSQIESLKLKDTVYYLGFREDVPQIISNCDFLIIPSLMETFSLAALEAMATSLPVVATECGGPSEIITHDETGFIVPKNDPLALCQKILVLSENKVKSKILGSNGLIKFNKIFRAEIYAQNFQNLYYEIANAGKASCIPNGKKFLFDSCLDFYQRHVEEILKLKDTSNVVAELNLQLAENRLEIIRLNYQLTELSSALNNSEVQIAERDLLLSDINRQIAVQAQYMTEGQEKAVQMAAQNAELIGEVVGLRNSMSWQITKPLRLLFSFFGKFR